VSQERKTKSRRKMGKLPFGPLGSKLVRVGLRWVESPRCRITAQSFPAFTHGTAPWCYGVPPMRQVRRCLLS